MASFHDLYKKYDIPAPRYTSYPTVPYWDTVPTSQQWIGHVKQTLGQDNSSLSLYVHLPYCETLCTFCGCNTSITKDHKKEEPYIDLVLKELDLYIQAVPELKNKPLRQLHLGGGSPTFFSSKNLENLVQGIFQRLKKDSQFFEGAIEVDPRRTQKDQLAVLRKLGFNRVSCGVQDFNPEVQRLVNRIQPFELTKNVISWARELGFESINMDLIYGLALQTADSIKQTALQTLEIKPDRIALYSLAIVPWIKPQQKLFKDEDLPKGEDKRNLYETAREILLNQGYKEIGMDHFALESDTLYEASKRKTLHRNFMGYTDIRTDVLLGLGVSSISETPHSFHQNEKILNVYEQKLNKNQLPSFRGHILSDTDKVQREKILKFMTEYEVEIKPEELPNLQEFLKEMLNDGLVKIEHSKLKLTEQGRPFLRNAAMYFDERLKAKTPSTRIFSQSV